MDYRALLRIIPLLALTAFSALRTSYGEPSEIDRKVDEAVGNWQTLTPQIINDPANREWVQKLREYAIKEHDMGAMIPLINAGDPEVLKDAINVFRDKDRRTQTEGFMEKCAQPKIIAAIADDLNINESAQIKRVEDSGTEPQSLATAHLIQMTIINSPVFSRELKAWANQFRPMVILIKYKENFRAQMRTWWAQNKDLFKAEKYSDVHPPQ